MESNENGADVEIKQPKNKDRTGNTLFVMNYTMM